MSLKRIISLAAALAMLPGYAHALGLGDVSGRAVLGQPIALSVPLLGEDVAGLRADCVTLQASAEIPSDGWVEGATLRIERDRLRITTRRPVAQPLIGFRLTVACGFSLSREYQVLPQLPQLPPDSPQLAPQEAAEPAVAIPARPDSPVAVPASGGGDFVVGEPTTLRLMSRQRYPDNSRARVAFIRRVAAANPAIFPSLARAYDQALAPGLGLRIPEAAPKARLDPGAKPPPSKPARAPRASQDKLVVGAGAGAAANRRMDELESDFERVVGLMNDQVLIQMDMARRLSSMEADVAAIKRALLAQQAESQKLAAELRELRAEQERSGYIQLVLGILLLGVTVGGFLLWRENSRARAKAMALETEVTHPALAPAAPVAAKAKPAEVEMPSLFDDLLPPAR